MDIEIVNLGLIDYDNALCIQKRLHSLRRAQQINDILLLLEHPPIITSGRKASEKHVLATKQELDMKGIKTYVLERGGDVTYHGPGQIIGYTIFDLSEHGKDIKTFVRNLEEVFIRLLCTRYNISASRDQKYTGVWVNHEKILAIGLSVKSFVTMHGFAFNVSTNMEQFQLIVPCGIKDKGVTSLSRLLGYTPDLSLITEQIVSILSEVFEAHCVFRDKNWLFSIISQY